MALLFAAMVVWAAFLPWLEEHLTGETVSGWDLYRTAGDTGVNRFVIGEFFREGVSPFFTGLAVVTSGAALGVVALALLLWPRDEPPATGKVPVWLKAVMGFVGSGAILFPVVNLFSYTLTGPDLPIIGITYGMLVWMAALLGFFVAAVVSAVPTRRERLGRPAGQPVGRGPRIALQILLTIVALVGFVLAVGLPCAFEETDAARSACLETGTAKAWLVIGIGGALLGLILIWAGPPILRRHKAGRHPIPSETDRYDRPSPGRQRQQRWTFVVDRGEVSQTKRCPLCAEEIKAEASLCRYCGARFELCQRGYCQSCHAVVELEDTSRCPTCGTEVIDRTLHSRLVGGDEARLQPKAATPELPELTAVEGEVKEGQRARPVVRIGLVTVIIAGALFGLFWVLFLRGAGTEVPTGPDTIAFVSFRGGDSEIYVMNGDGSNQTRLSDNRYHDGRPAWSPDGTRIAFASLRDGNWDVCTMNVNGSREACLTEDPAYDEFPAWAPDGTKVAFQSDRDGPYQIYVMNADGTGQTRLTNVSADDSTPSWSPDGTAIAFSSERDGDREIYVMDADGSAQTNLSSSPESGEWFPAWSPDGSKIAFITDRDGNWEIYVMNADGTGQTRLTSDPADDAAAAWSRDGTRIAFTSDRDGDFEIYVMHADGTGLTRLTESSGDDLFPAWSPSTTAVPTVTSTVTSVSSTAQPTTAQGLSEEQKALADALVDYFLAEGAEEGDPMADDLEAMRCYVEDLVSEFGVERLGEFGFTVDSMPEDLEALLGEMTDEELGIDVDLMLGCIDFTALMVEEMMAEGLSRESAECYAAEVADSDFYREALLAGMRGEEFDPMAHPELAAVVMDAATKCFSGEGPGGTTSP